MRFILTVGLALLLGAKPGRFTPLFKTLATAMLVLTVACVARDARGAEELAAGAERWLSAQDWVLVSCDLTLVTPEDD